MKILVVGGSRGLGRQTVKAALAAGHTVTVFSRHPESIKIAHNSLRLQSGDVLDVSSLSEAVRGQDAVICVLGLPTRKAIGPPFAKKSYVLSEGTKNILEAMSGESVKRFICVTAIGAGDSAGLCTPLARLVLRGGLRWLFKEKDRQEKLIENSAADWTIIRPTALTNGGGGKKDTIVSESFESGVLTHVSRADVARVMVEILNKPETRGKKLIISYKARLGDSIRWVIGYAGIGNL